MAGNDISLYSVPSDTDPDDVRLRAPSAGSITGTANITEAADTVAATGTVLVRGAATITESADTVAGAGTVASSGTITGAANITEAADTVAASGSVRSAAPAGGGAARGNKQNRPVIVWKMDEVEEVVEEAVAAIQARPPKRGPKPKHVALFGPTAARIRPPTQTQVIAEVRRIVPDGPTTAQILAAFARIREQDDEEAALMLLAA